MLHASNLRPPRLEPRIVQPSLTVVLPVHNCERTIRQDVADVLEAASELTQRVEVLIVDDASKDDTFETAGELARDFRQVRVIRRGRRQDLADTLGEVRSSIDSDVVIVHDGSSRVNSEQLRLIWRQQQVLGAVRDAGTGSEGVSFADLRRPSMTQPAMEVAHRRLWGFQRVAAAPAAEATPAPMPEPMPEPIPEPIPEPSDNRRTDEPAQAGRSKRGVGVIPNLPRPNVMGSITNFALGE